MSGEPTEVWWFCQMDRFFMYGQEGLSHLNPNQQQEVIQRFREKQKEARRER